MPRTRDWRSSRTRQQAAVDFMVSYGIAVLLIAISIYVVARLGIFSNSLTQPTCSTSASFSCGAFVFSANGMLTFALTQAISSGINITAVACSSGINVTGNKPQYGNVGVLDYAAASQYYPNNALSNGLMMYGDTSAIITVYCYGSGGVSAQNLGTPYTGYVWINYTSQGLPSSYHAVQRVLQFAARSS